VLVKVIPVDQQMMDLSYNEGSIQLLA